MNGNITGSDDSLDELRRAIDTIDDTMLDLLTERAALGVRIASAKKAAHDSHAYGNVYLRPGREMEILRRLVARSTGPFPKPVIVRLWRELFAALLSLQGPMSMAIFMPTQGADYLKLARDQYGSFTSATTFPATGPVIRAIAEGDAIVGILPLPRFEEEAPWWPSLTSQKPDTPRIIARLPLCRAEPLHRPENVRGNNAEALVISRMPLEKTADDRSLIALEAAADISRGSIRVIIEANNLPLVDFMDSHSPGDGRRLHLANVSEFVHPEDPRLDRLKADSQILHAVVIGAYAVPFAAEDLFPPEPSEQACL